LRPGWPQEPERRLGCQLVHVGVDQVMRTDTDRAAA
jgi:hypothetical protein